MVKNASPTPLVGFVQEGFFVKVYTCFFFADCLVFAKSGSFNPDTSGTMRASLGGYTEEAMIAGAVGKLFDSFTSRERNRKAMEVNCMDPDSLVSAHKNNFKVKYADISKVEITKPGWAGETKIRVNATEAYKFTMKGMPVGVLESTFNKFVAGKVVVK
jgi:hypothetical protein